MSYGIHSRSSDWHLDFARARPLDPSRRELRRYVNDFILDNSSKRTLSRNIDPDTAPNRIPSVPERDQTSPPECSDHTVDPGPAPGRESGWASAACATTKLAINILKGSSDEFPPLKSVVGGLSAILDHCDVRLISSKLSCP